MRRINVESGRSSFSNQSMSKTPNVTYIIDHTIGITKLGIHWDGLISASNHGLPIETKTEPSPATITIATIDKIIFNVLFFMVLIYVKMKKI